MFTDSVDAYSAIYSLAAFGLERFIAGGARHSLMKIFDLRMTGGKQYFAADLDSCSPDALQFNAKPSFCGVEKPTCCQHHYDTRNVRSNTNIFLGHCHNDKGAQRNRRDSPVYSLSSPSSCSPTLFAGIENQVIQIDIVSIMDQYPDPIFQHEPKRTLSLDSYIRMKWNPRSDALCLPASEMVNGKISLMIQSRIGVAKGCKRGFDERWQLPKI